jgi:hypothetical protein
MGKDSGPEKPKPTQEERALAERGAREFNRFVDDFVPAIHKSVEEAQATSSDFRDVGAQTSAEAASSGSSTRELARAGPTAVRQAGAENRGLDRARGTALAQAVPQFEQRENQAMLSAAQQGRGVAGQASQSAARAGNQATSAGIQAMQQEFENDRALRQGLISAGSTAAGAAMESGLFSDLSSASAGSGVAGNIPNRTLRGG